MIDGYNATVYMDRRDVSSWVKSVEIRMEDSMTRRFTIEFAAWHSFNENARWDIFESTDPTNPRQECTIRNGLIDPSQRKSVEVGRGKVPRIIARGYEWAWLAQRKRPTETIVFVPSGSDVDSNVRAAIEDYGKPVGEFRVWRAMDSNHDVIIKLMQSAGIRASVRIPWHTISAFVMPPTKSYYRQALDLAEPYGAAPMYVRATNTMIFADQRDMIMGGSNTMTIPDDLVDSFTARPKYRSRATRIIVRFPPWH